VKRGGLWCRQGIMVSVGRISECVNDEIHLATIEFDAACAPIFVPVALLAPIGFYIFCALIGGGFECVAAGVF